MTTIDELKYNIIDSSLLTGRVGDGTENYGNADSTSRTKDVIIESHFTVGSSTYKVIEVGMNAFRNCSQIKFVFIPDTVIIIGIRAFHSCSALKSIMLPGSISYIDTYSFSNLSPGIIANFTFCGDSDSEITLGSNPISSHVISIYVPSTFTGSTCFGKPLESSHADTWCNSYYSIDIPVRTQMASFLCTNCAFDIISSPICFFDALINIIFIS